MLIRPAPVGNVNFLYENDTKKMKNKTANNINPKIKNVKEKSRDDDVVANSKQNLNKGRESELIKLESQIGRQSNEVFIILIY